jgi:hypothetical protein
MKSLDRIANVAIIVAVAVFLMIVVRNEIDRHHAASGHSQQDFVGKTISLPGVRFTPGHNALVVAISTACHFCKDSLPFYKDLAARANGHVALIAVLPQPQSDAAEFLDKAGVATTQTVTASLDSIGVSGTPTVLLVDGSGKVTAAWVGKLDEKGQQSLIHTALPNAG